MHAYIRLPRRAALLLMLPLAACATMTSTSRHEMERGPYYHGKARATTAKVAWAGVSTTPMRFGLAAADTESSGAMRALLDSLEARLVGMDIGPRLDAARLVEGAPVARLGCETSADDEAPVRVGKWYHSADCRELADNEEPRNALAVTSGRKAWREQVRRTIDSAGVDYLLLVSFALADQWPVQKGWTGAKEVRLGSGYALPLPWLTGERTPVSVAQLGAVLVDRDGKVVRAGVEGLTAAKPRTLETLTGAQRALSDDDLRRLATSLRRTDLPGQPLVRDAAVEAMVEQMLWRKVVRR